MSGLGKNHWCPCRCVTPWYLKRGFLGFCFFDEDETHLVNLFSSIKSHLEGLLVQTSASGKGITVGSLPVDRHEWWTAKPVPYIRVCIHMTSVACLRTVSVQSVLRGLLGVDVASQDESVAFTSVLSRGT